MATVIPELPQAQNVLLVGPVASGKSYILEHWVAPLQRVLVFDTTCEFDSDPSIEQIWSGARELGERLRENQVRFRVAYHPKNVESDFNWSMRILWQLDLDRHIIVDEVQEVSHLEIMDSALRYGRKRLLGIVGATQRIADVNKTFSANSRLVILFFTQESNDLDAIRDRYGKSAQKMVESLRPLIYDDTSKVVRQTPQALVIYRGSPMKVVDIGEEVRAEGGEGMGAPPEPPEPEEEEVRVETEVDGEV